MAATTMTGGRLDVNSAIRSCHAPPAAPTLSAIGGDGQVILTWTGAAGALSFDVKRSLAAGGPYTVIAPGVKGKTYTDTTVVNDTTYYYVVSGRNPLGESGDSNEASATPKVASDLVVSALTVPSKGAAGVALDPLEHNTESGRRRVQPDDDAVLPVRELDDWYGRHPAQRSACRPIASAGSRECRFDICRHSFRHDCRQPLYRREDRRRQSRSRDAGIEQHDGAAPDDWAGAHRVIDRTVDGCARRGDSRDRHGEESRRSPGRRDDNQVLSLT